MIQHQLENPIATKLLAGDVQPGDTIHVEYEAEQFKLTSGQQPTTA